MNDTTLLISPTGLLFVSIALAAVILALTAFSVHLARQRREVSLLNTQLAEKLNQRQALDAAAQAIASQLDLQATLIEVCAQARGLTGSSKSAVHLIARSQNLVRMPHADGFTDDFLRLNRIYSTDLEERTTSLSTGLPMIIPVIEDLQQPSFFSDSLLAQGVRSYADFPLSDGENVFGYLSIYFDKPRGFEPEVLEIIASLSAHASKAIQNAIEHAHTETALVRRAHQLEILENVGRELAAASHSGSLFELILDQALEFTNSPWGGLYLFDPSSDSLQIRAGRGLVSSRGETPKERDPRWEAIERGESVVLDGADPTAQGHFLSSGARSHVSVPLIHNRKAVGVLSIESPKENAFTRNDQLFVNQLATQAAVALVNATLYEEARQHLLSQSALYQASRQLVGNLELDTVVENILQSFHASLQSQASGAYVWDEAQQGYRLAALAGEVPEAVDHLPKVVQQQIWEESRAARLGTGILQLSPGGEHARSPLSPYPGCQTLTLPLARGEKLLGLILSYIPENLNLKDSDLQLPRAIAAQGAIAMQNALLYQDVREGRDRLEAVLNSVEEGVLMIDEEERVILVNQVIEKMTGIPLENISGQAFANLPAPVLDLIGVNPTEGESVFRILMQPDRLNHPRVTFPSDGDKTERIYARFASPVWGQGQEGIGWVFVFRDVSEEHQLAQARELLTETLVHDLRSPIGAVGSALGILEEVLPDDLQDPAVGQTLEIARRSTGRVTDLVESILDISRMEAGPVDLDLTRFDLASLGAELIQEYTPQANELGIILLNELPAKAMFVRADQRKITRVLVNLIDNALKFTPEGGQISLGTIDTPDEDQIWVIVSDTGPGIPEEYRLEIFNRFSQIPGIRSRRRGSGLGLTFCRLVLEAHGGKIWVEGSPDEGSQFIFNLQAASSS